MKELLKCIAVMLLTVGCAVFVETQEKRPSILLDNWGGTPDLTSFIVLPD